MADLLRSFRKRANKAYFQRKIASALGIKPLLEPSHFSIPNIDWEIAGAAREKQILFVTPLHGPNASAVYTDFVLAEFRRRGYAVHTVVYSNTDHRPTSAQWDHVYYLKSQNGRFLKSRDQGDGRDFDNADDWAGDDLALFVGALAAATQFEICIANYVFLSRVLELQRPTTVKLLITHDVFSGRNGRILKTYGREEAFFFSTSWEEECRGLNRADVVVAIQDEEAAAFAKGCPGKSVATLPFVPSCRFADAEPKTPISIGFIASDYRANVDAIKRFITEFKPECGEELIVAGSISRAMRKLDPPEFVKVVGRVKALDDFYARCDLIINPDTLKSGLKIKCVEALSFGKPLVCTSAASTGMGLEADYHRAGSISEVAEWVEKAAQDPALLVEMAAESRRAFEAFREKYSVERFADDIISKVTERG